MMKASFYHQLKKKMFGNKNGSFNDYKVSPMWAVATVVFTLAIIINSGILIFNARLFTIKNDENKVLTEELSKKKNVVEKGLDVANDEYAEKILKELLPASQLTALAKTFWSYELDVNDTKIASNDLVATAPNVKFTLKQFEKDRILPINLHNRGSVTAGDIGDKFYEHPSFITKINYVLTPPLSNTNPAIATYEFKDLKVGEKINLTLTPPLQERLGLAKNQINITIK